jgi:hypothetical protein
MDPSFAWKYPLVKKRDLNIPALERDILSTEDLQKVQPEDLEVEAKGSSLLQSQEFLQCSRCKYREQSGSLPLLVFYSIASL